MAINLYILVSLPPGFLPIDFIFLSLKPNSFPHPTPKKRQNSHVSVSSKKKKKKMEGWVLDHLNVSSLGSSPTCSLVDLQNLCSAVYFMTYQTLCKLPSFIIWCYIICCHIPIEKHCCRKDSCAKKLNVKILSGSQVTYSTGDTLNTNWVQRNTRQSYSSLTH